MVDSLFEYDIISQWSKQLKDWLFESIYYPTEISYRYAILPRKPGLLNCTVVRCSPIHPNTEASLEVLGERHFPPTFEAVLSASPFTVTRNVQRN